MTEEVYLDELEGKVVEISKTFDAPHNTVVIESDGIFYYLRLDENDHESVKAACSALSEGKKLRLKMTFEVVN